MVLSAQNLITNGDAESDIKHRNTTQVQPVRESPPTGNSLPLPVWDIAALSQPTVTQAQECPVKDLEAIWIDGLSYKGKKTKIFAYLGTPKNSDGKLPGVVLVHGGGGSAMDEWVRKWNEKGYVAIAFDMCGQIPERTADGKAWRRTETLGNDWIGGPDRTGQHFSDDHLPVQEQWTYHAVADALLATSVLAAHPQVDPGRIGIVGISWGSVVCSIAGGIDKRLAFVVPQYIGGFFKLGAWAGYMNQNPSSYRWDPANYYAGNPTGTAWLWINGTNDWYGNPPMFTASWFSTSPRSWMVMNPTLGHGHNWMEGKTDAVNEIYAFADGVVNGGKPLPQISHTAWEADSVTLSWSSQTPIANAQFVYATSQPASLTVDGHQILDWSKVEYKTQDVSLPAEASAPGENHQVTFVKPADMLAGWINLIDNRGYRVTSTFLDSTGVPR